jgi:hypothetical protein
VQLHRAFSEFIRSTKTHQVADVIQLQASGLEKRRAKLHSEIVRVNGPGDDFKTDSRLPFFSSSSRFRSTSIVKSGSENKKKRVFMVPQTFPERNNPERKNPERKNPERKNLECKNPECKNPERKNPEHKNPECKNPQKCKNPESVKILASYPDLT